MHQQAQCRSRRPKCVAEAKQRPHGMSRLVRRCITHAPTSFVEGSRAIATPAPRQSVCLVLYLLSRPNSSQLSPPHELRE
jgi:hypothetical protein